MTLNGDIFNTGLKSISGLKNKSKKKKKDFALDERNIKPFKHSEGVYSVAIPKEMNISKMNIAVITSKKKIIAPKLSGIKTSIEFKMLRPIDQKVILYIKSQIKNNENSKHVLIINNDLIAEIGISKSSLRNSICNLTKNKTLIVSKTRNGPGGWRLFEINELLETK